MAGHRIDSSSVIGMATGISVVRISANGVPDLVNRIMMDSAKEYE